MSKALVLGASGHIGNAIVLDGAERLGVERAAPVGAGCLDEFVRTHETADMVGPEYMLRLSVGHHARFLWMDWVC